jgi:YbbR domain-containing protein
LKILSERGLFRAVRFFIKNFSSIFISLALAVLVWVAAVKEQNPPIENDYNQLIPIEVMPPSAGLINTTPLPEAVKLRLKAPDSSWTDLSPAKFKASIDLSALPAGLAEVPVKLELADPYVDIVEQQPANVSVNLEPLKTISMPVTVDVLDSAPLGYVARTPVANPPLVHLSGPATLIDKASRVVAEVFIRNSKETIETKPDVVVRDANDKRINGLKIDPTLINVTLPIDQRFGYKDVSVRVNLQGQVASGYRVSNIRVDPPTLTVVGNPAGLAQITGVVETAPVNLNEATETIVRTVPLSLPDGVTVVLAEEQKNSPEGVLVTVEITAIEDGLTLKRPITQQGLDARYWWRATPDQADVFLSGPLTQLQTLRASDVEVLVDLFNLEPGVHVLQPTVFKPEGLRLDALVPENVEVTIGRTVLRPVMVEGGNPDYTWKPTPDTVAVNLVAPLQRLNQVNPADIIVSVDISNLEPGFYALKPEISLPDSLVIDSIKPDTVNLTIKARSGIQTPTKVMITPTVTITGSTPVSQNN